MARIEKTCGSAQAIATRARMAASAPIPIHNPRWLLAAGATGLAAATGAKGGGAAAADWAGGAVAAGETGVNPPEIAEVAEGALAKVGTDAKTVG